MTDVLQRVEHHEGDNHQTRLMLSFDTLFPREADTALGQLFDYWRNVTGEGMVADEHVFRPADYLPAETARWISWIDTRAPSPLDFVWRDHIYAWEGEASHEFHDASDVRVRDYASQRHGRFCATEYHICKSLRRPLYHEIEQWSGGVHRHYLRLLLPVRTVRDEVSRLVYVCRRV